MQKFGKQGFLLPAEIEATILTRLGNMYLDPPADKAATVEWFRRARLELVGHPEKQDYIQQCSTNGVRIDARRLLRRWKPEESTANDLTAESESC